MSEMKIIKSDYGPTLYESVESIHTVVVEFITILHSHECRCREHFP